MTFYTGAIILTELMMLAMSLHVVNYSGFTGRQKVWYLLTFISIMLCAGAEFAVHCGYYTAALAAPLTVLTVLQFSIAPLLGVLFIGALGLHKQAKIAAVFFVANLVAEIVCAPFGWVFYFDAQGYHRGDHFFIYETFYFISLIYLIINMFIVGKKFRRRDLRTIVMILIILVAGILPMTLFKINITYFAIAISASLCYIYYNDLVQQDVHAELVAHEEKISAMQAHMISGLANLIENRDMETGEHISRTSRYVEALAKNARADGYYTDVLSDRFITQLYSAAPLHDIGKILIPDSILKKPGKLTADEFEQMKKHAQFGGNVVREVLSGVADEEYISLAADVASCHHERWDGTGYPFGLKGEQIPLSARIMALADVYDALVSERCYKKAMQPEEAFEVIRSEAGSHFDPVLAQVFLAHREDFLPHDAP